VIGVDELPAAETSTGLAIVAPEAGLQIVTEGAAPGVHAPNATPAIAEIISKIPSDCARRRIRFEILKLPGGR
jgi:hypothetical protein